MKKALFLLISIIVISSSHAQETKKDSLNGIFPLKGNVVYYEEVVSQDGTKDELYIKAKSALVDMFKSSNKVIQMEDKEAGILIGKGFFKISFGVMSNYDVFFTLKIQAKDGRYKIDMYDINTSDSVTIEGYTATSEWTLDEWEYVLKNKKRSKKLNDKIISFFETIKTLIKESNTSSPSNNDW